MAFYQRVCMCVHLSVCAYLFWLECVSACACFYRGGLSLLLHVTHFAELFEVKILYSGLAKTSAVELHRHGAP